MTVRRSAKDTVFRDLFGRPEYLLELYKALHPEDTTVTADAIADVTIENILTDRMYNDLGFTVGDRLLILVEAQSTWSVNIIIRAFLYLAQSYQDRFESRKANIYSSKKLSIPEPELYVLYTGDRKERPESISLSNEFFEGRKTALDVTVKLLYGDDQSNIIGQYTRFCKVLNMQIKKYGFTDEAVLETIRICRDENVLKAYLDEHEKEAIGIMMALFNEEYIHEAYGIEKYDEGFAVGEARGAAKHARETAINMRSLGMTDDTISAVLKCSPEQVKQLLADAIAPKC